MLDRLRDSLRRPPTQLPAPRGQAAVAAVFTPGLELLLMQRAEHPGDPWSGHISLPGGRVEPDDVDPLSAAIRETEEEVGLQLHPSQLLGPLDDLAAVGGRPGLIIRPFVFLIDQERPLLQPNEEVAGLHWLSLQDLLEGRGRGQMEITFRDRRHTLPCVDFADDKRLWGLTLRMIDGLLDRLDGRGVGPMR